MSLIVVLIGIICLIILIGYFKFNTFLSFVLVSIGIGICLGMSVSDVSSALQKGIGDTLGFLVIILGCGAMLGKLVADSGAAQRISDTLISLFPQKYILWALVLTGFLVGIPMFYSVGFVILVPLIFTIGATTRLPLLYIGLPMLAALSVTHGYLPPHPAPTALAAQFGADIGTTMIYGLIVAIPAIILGGPIFATTLKKYNPKPLAQFMNRTPMTDAQMPGVAVSIFTALLPVFLIGTSASMKFVLSDDSILMPIISIFGDPAIAMIISVVVAIYTLGIGQGRSLVTVGESFESAIKGIAMILLIIAGAGALKSILVESQISDYIGNQLAQIAVSPLILAWGIAALIRVCVGSATVAGLTSAGIVAPLIPITGADPNLMVLATGAGSLMFSHINDSGFWLFKEFFNMSVVDTLKTWSIMETIVSVAGLLGVLCLNFIIN